jgi:protein XRP2
VIDEIQDPFETPVEILIVDEELPEDANETKPQE